VVRIDVMAIKVHWERAYSRTTVGENPAKLLYCQARSFRTHVVFLIIYCGVNVLTVFCYHSHYHTSQLR
jgi:hypothetical protein